jgi:hypothetical protein
MTPQERTYLGRKKKHSINWNLWFVDIVIAGVLAAIVAAIVIGLAITIVFITPGAHAETIEDNSFYCHGIAAGTFNVAPEDREEVSAYCENHD